MHIAIKVRQADLSDAPVIADFNLRLARETENLRLHPATVRKGVAALLRDPAKGHYYVAETGEAVIGQIMITFEWSDWRNANLWWLQSVYVREDFRRRGVFGMLFRHVKAVARRRMGVCALRLYMHADNARARQAYEALGMRRTKYEVFDLELKVRSKGATE